MFDPSKYGIHIGKGLVNPERTLFWLNIPKCASNTVSYHLLRKQWKSATIHDAIYQKVYVCLRDPVQRWKAATLELCYHHLLVHTQGLKDFDTWFYQRDFKNFDRNLDMHHVRQIDYLHYCDLSKCEFLYIDDSFSDKLAKTFDISEEITTKNITQKNDYKKQIKCYVDEIMTKDFVNHLTYFYKSDYELINKVSDLENGF